MHFTGWLSIYVEQGAVFDLISPATSRSPKQNGTMACCEENFVRIECVRLLTRLNIGAYQFLWAHELLQGSPPIPKAETEEEREVNM